MNTTSIIKNQKNKEIRFNSRLDWLEKKRCLVTSDEVKDTIRIATPAVFGGEGNEWSPEHLFISAIAGCFMSTYLYFADKLEFETSHLICEARGKIELSDGKYVFTQIELYPKIFIANEAYRAKAQQALKKAISNSLVANSSRVPVSCRAEILYDMHPRHKTFS